MIRRPPRSTRTLSLHDALPICHSLAELRASKGHLDTLLAQGAKVPKGVFGCHVDSQSNSVVVTIGRRGQQAGIDFVALSRSEEHTSELQSLMRISYAVFCLQKKKKQSPQQI